MAARFDVIPTSLNPATIKTSAPVTWLFQARWVKRIYYALKPRLGLGWEGQFNPAKPAQALSLQQQEIEALRALGYIGGVTKAVNDTGVTVHLPEYAWPGFNLDTDGFEPEATLRDMDGAVLHRWKMTFDDALPDSPAFEGEPGSYNWRRVKLLENGDLLAIYEGHGIIKLDRDSNLIWGYDRHAHHDMEPLPDGSVWVLTREAEIVPSISEDQPILHDFVVLLNPDGIETRRISVLQAIQNSVYVSLLDLAPKSGDILHTNEIEILSGESADEIPAFQKGRLLLSIRNMNSLVVLDTESEQIVWALTGLWVRQHASTVLENGNLLVFDNLGRSGSSRVVEFNPSTQELVWSYGSGVRGFRSGTCGGNQRFPNGNTLITESDYGRAFEVTREGKIVWEYFTPDRTGDHDEFIATLFEVFRLEQGFPLDWLN